MMTDHRVRLIRHAPTYDGQRGDLFGFAANQGKGQFQQTYRVLCTCGWASDWENSIGRAGRAGRDHVTLGDIPPGGNAA
jgi:hypothetical protein